MNILDVVFCNDPQIISDCYVEPPLAGSDHNLVGFDFLLPSHVPVTQTYAVTDNLQYDFNNVDLPNVCVVKDLGITIDSRLDYSDHINTIVT